MNLYKATHKVNCPDKILKTVLNRITIIPHLEVAGIFETDGIEDAISHVVSNALKLRQSKYGDIHNNILHFILIGYEFYDELDDDPIEEYIIQGFKSAGVQSALLTIFAMQRREIITHRAFEKFYSNKEFLPKLSLNDELDVFTHRLLNNKLIMGEPRIFTFYASKMTKEEKALARFWKKAKDHIFYSDLFSLLFIFISISKLFISE